VCVCVCDKGGDLPFHLLEQLTEFHQTSYEIYAILRHITPSYFNFMQSVITTGVEA
jgi:hypothetical protein